MQNQIIIIDAGHGGSDIGENYHNFKEKDYNLYFSKLLKTKLESKNFLVQLTRDDDYYVTNTNRIKIINNQVNSSSIILSIHSHFNNSNNFIIKSIKDNTNLANTISNYMNNNTNTILTYKRLPVEPNKDYYSIQRENNNNLTVVIDLYFDLNNIDNNCECCTDNIINALSYYSNNDNRSTYIVKKNDNLYNIAASNNTTVDEIKKLNNLTSNNLYIGQKLTIPDLYETKDWFLYTVKSGDNLYSISRKYNTDVNSIKNLNYLKSNNLSIGQVLKIPLSSTDKDQLVIEEYQNYTVQKGDSLYSIAKKFNTTINDIIKDNNLTTTTLKLNQVLKIKKSETKTPIVKECFGEDLTTNTYIVKKGDSLYLIAKKFNTTIDKIIKDNNLTTTTLKIGQELIVPYSEDIYHEYTVKKGDSLYSISKMFNTTINEIKQLNNLITNTLSIGQILNIKAGN